MEGFDLGPEIIATVVQVVEALVNEEGQVVVEGRTIKYKAKGRFHSISEPWVYDGTAWDIMSGISKTARHYKSTHGAIKNAVLKLVDKLDRNRMLVPQSKL